MKNDQGNKTRRRKVALTNRERSLKHWNLVLTGAAMDAATTKEDLSTDIEIAKRKIELCTAEIATLKKRIGGPSYVA